MHRPQPVGRCCARCEQEHDVEIFGPKVADAVLAPKTFAIGIAVAEYGPARAPPKQPMFPWHSSLTRFHRDHGCLRSTGRADSMRTARGKTANLHWKNAFAHRSLRFRQLTGALKRPSQ